MLKPFISILIPSYNSEKYIEKTLSSCTNQTVSKDFYEIIIVNDGSTDKSPEIIEKISKNSNNIRVFSQKNMGLSRTRNTLLAHIAKKSEWLIWLDADDTISPQYVECFYKWLNMGDNAIKYNIVKSNWIMDEKHKKSVLNKMNFKIDDRIMVRVIKRSLFDNYKFPDFKYAIEDWDFWVNKFDEIRSTEFNDTNFNYYYTFNENSLTRTKVVKKSMLLHAISVLSNPRLYDIVVKKHVVEHYYTHLYMMARIWFPSLKHQVLMVKYKTKEPLIVKLQLFLVKCGIFNWIIRLMYKKNEDI